MAHTDRNCVNFFGKEIGNRMHCTNVTKFINEINERKVYFYVISFFVDCCLSMIHTAIYVYLLEPLVACK